MDYVITKSIKDYIPFDNRTLKPTIFPNKKDEINTNGLVLQRVDIIEDKNFSIRYFTPNNVAILRYQCEKNLKEYENILKENVLKNYLGEKYKNINTNEEKMIWTSSMVYEMICYAQASIIFAYTTIEAFANLSIPNDYIYECYNNKGIKESYDKKGIERWMSLSLKIKDILPKIYGTPKIQNEKFWNRFLKLEELRNNIIHQKTITANDYYKDYFKTETIDVIKVFQQIIGFFNDNKKENQGMALLIWPWIVEEKGIAIPIINSVFEPSQMSIIRNPGTSDEKEYLIINTEKNPIKAEIDLKKYVMIEKQSKDASKKKKV